MKNEKNFYEILNDKFNERQIPFDEENWKAMRLMIDESRASNRRAIWLIASLALLLCAGGTFALYQWSNGKSNAIYTTTPANSSVQTANGNNKQAPTSLATANTKLINDNNSHSSASSDEPSNQTQSLANGINPGHTIANASSFHSKRSRNGSFTANPVSNNITPGNNVVSTNKGTNASIAQENNHSNNVTASATKAGNPSSVPASPKALPVSSTPAVKTAALVSKTTVHKTDSAATGDLPPRFSDEPRVYGGKTNLFSVEAGSEYAFGWQIGSVVQGKGFNILAGVGYSHYMGSKIFLKTSVQFSTFGNMSPITYNYQHNIGNVIYDSVITTQRLYFLRIPVQLEYSIGRKKNASIGAGGAVWFLLGNSGYATTYQQTDYNPPTNIIKYSQNAPLNGYSKVNASAHILYKYTFNHHFSMYGIFYLELTNMKDNAFFGENIIQRTRGVQFTVSYNLN